MMIEVFKTNVQNLSTAKTVEQALTTGLGYTKVSFDLEDCDRILRIEATAICTASVIRLLKALECECEVLTG